MKRINIIIGFLSSLICIGYGTVLYIAYPTPIQKTLKIVCTTTLLADAVRTIAGDLVHIKTLMGPGVDPHIYQARESDAHALAQATIIFYHGLHLEGKLSHLLSHMPAKQCISVSDAIPRSKLLQGDTPEIYDPHIWHDVQLWKHVINTIALTLQSIDPQHMTYYHSNAKRYISELDQLDNMIKWHIKKIAPSKRILITAHDAFSYFGKAYGFRIIALQGINTQIEVNMRDIATIVDTIIHNHIPTMFLENSTPERNIQAIQCYAAERNWAISIGSELFSDSLDDPKNPAGTYAGMIIHNIQSIVNGLNN